MGLTAGTRLASYEVTGPLGAGGMGEVYRARDTRLNRDVALKVLPDAFAGDPERLARFEREPGAQMGEHATDRGRLVDHRFEVQTALTARARQRVEPEQ